MCGRIKKDKGEGDRLVQWGQGCFWEGDSDIWREQRSGPNKEENNKVKDRQTNYWSDKEKLYFLRTVRRKRGYWAKDRAEVPHCRTTMSCNYQLTAINGPTRYLPPTLLPSHLSCYWTAPHRVTFPASRKNQSPLCVWLVQQHGLRLTTLTD